MRSRVLRDRAFTCHTKRHDNYEASTCTSSCRRCLLSCVRHTSLRQISFLSRCLVVIGNVTIGSASKDLRAVLPSLSSLAANLPCQAPTPSSARGTILTKRACWTEHCAQRRVLFILDDGSETFTSKEVLDRSPVKTKQPGPAN